MIKEKESWWKMNKKIVIIIGVLSGFGLLIIFEFVKKNYLVIVIMWNFEK